MSLRGNHKVVAAGVIVLTYFLLLTHGGLATYFTLDDVQNIAFLHGYGKTPIAALLAQALTVFTPEYRPVGGVYYRTLYALFGLHATPFRIAFFILLGVNVVLAWRWFRQLSGSHMTAAAAALLFSFHPALADLYYNNGTVYDVLCLLFLLIALGYYTQIRETDTCLEMKQLLIIAALYGAALGSKEMALTLPGILILYEAVYHPYWRDLRRRGWPILLVTVMTVLCMILKIAVPNHMSSNFLDLYTPSYSAAIIAKAYLHYYQFLLVQPELNGAALGATLILALLAALTLRNRGMLFGMIFANLTLLPVCAIPPRAGFVWYIPLIGWALYGGSVMSQISSSLSSLTHNKRFFEKLGLSNNTLAQALLFGTLAIGLYALHAPRAALLGAPFQPQQLAFQNLLAAARTAAPSLPSGSRILLESDPFPEFSWEPLFLLRLGYEDSTLWVDRASHLGKAYNPQDTSLHAMTMRWDGSRYQVAVRPPPQGESLQLTITPGIVRRGRSSRIQLPADYAGCPIDVAYRMPQDELIRGGVWSAWTTLDANGSGEFHVDQDAESGKIVIDRIRACRRDWMPAAGSFMIWP